MSLPAIVVDEPALLPALVAALVAAVLPALPVPMLPCAVAPAPPGVPVVPMGVFWLLRWPAPWAGLVTEGFGGVPWAKARATVAVARPATMVFRMVFMFRIS
jgi:hypothetical protein